MSFTYNNDGFRVTKTVNGVVTTYYYQGSLLIAEETNSQILVYIYDVKGSPIGFKYRGSNYASGTWDTYAYEKNIQGDIVAVYDVSTGTKLISYRYNAWGLCGATYHNSGSTTTATKNPFKYRGYYYDSDLDMYYLQSRYYDPNNCRFINADKYVSTGQGLTGYNMFAYCENNPVMRVDPTGEFSWIAFIVIFAGAIIGGFFGNRIANRVEIQRRENGNTDEVGFLNNSATTGSDEIYTMPKIERIGYIAAGSLVGIASGGAIVSLSGVVGTLAVGTTKVIKLFGMTGPQMFALGALAYNIAFVILCPFLDIEQELIKTPKEQYNFSNPYIP